MKLKKKSIIATSIMVTTACMTIPMNVLAQDREFTVTAETYIADFGQTVQKFILEGVSDEAANVTAEDFVIANDITEAVQTVQGENDVTEVSYEDGTLILSVGEFRYLPSDFVVAYVGKENINLSFTKDQVSTVNTEIADEFKAEEENGVHYRIYIPEDVEEPVPMVIWTHGGGEKGTDNWAQIAANKGATAWIERYKDVVVLAPQAEEDWTEDIFEVIRNKIIELEEEGIVDPNRVYGSGCSFGGMGCILNAQYNKDLMTAIAPICPTMNEVSMPALKELTDMGVWVSTAVEDTFPERDDCVVECITELQNNGNENAQYTLYEPDEYLKYGLGTATDENELKNEYHHAWVLTLNNEYGIMDWLLEQSK